MLKRLEQATPNVKKFTPFNPALRPQKPWQKEKEAKAVPVPNIAELREAGRCFKCMKPWVPGHTKVSKCKKLFSVISVQNEEGKEEIAVVEDSTPSEGGEFHDALPYQTPKFSMHALLGVATTATPFTLRSKVGNNSN